MNHEEDRSRIIENFPGPGEFIALMALIISITALSIDMMLPALPEIGKDLGASHPNDVQLVVSVLIFGFGIGQIIYGPLSDCFGRKPAIFTGFLIFISGCLISVSATGFETMLAGRFIQGLGAAGPRTVTVALIRDIYGGRAMARILSVIMAVFIFVPAIAPALGQVVLLISDWHLIFIILMIKSLAVLTWFCIRQPETLDEQNRLPFSLKRIFNGIIQVITNRTALGYTLASGFTSGALMAYLNCAQQVFQEVFGLGREFPMYMAFLALSVGGASYVNSRIVVRLGMRKLSYRAVTMFIILTAAYLTITLVLGGQSPLWLMMTCFSMSFFCMGILFGNQNTIAMEPLSHIAGLGAAVIGSFASLISSAAGLVIGRFFNDSTMPLAAGFIILGLLTAMAMIWADRPSKRQNQQGSGSAG